MTVTSTPHLFCHLSSQTLRVDNSRPSTAGTEGGNSASPRSAALRATALPSGSPYAEKTWTRTREQAPRLLVMAGAAPKTKHRQRRKNDHVDHSGECDLGETGAAVHPSV